MMTLTDKINSFSLSQLADYAEIMLHSNCDDIVDVQEITHNIKSNFLSWIRSGILLDVVKKEFSFLVLKNKIAKNWKEYCLKFFNKTHWYINNIINASKVVLILIKNGFDVLPNCENQAKHLTRFLPDPDQMNQNECLELEQEICNLWQKVITRSNGQALTGNLVKSVVDPDSLEKKKTTIKLDNDTLDKLSEQAKENGFNSVNDYLIAIANNQISLNNSVEEVEQDKLEQWEKDLENLVNEELESVREDLSKEEDKIIFELANDNTMDEETLKELIELNYPKKNKNLNLKSSY
jgi:hypothetical protein